MKDLIKLLEKEKNKINRTKRKFKVHGIEYYYLQGKEDSLKEVISLLKGVKNDT